MVFACWAGLPLVAEPTLGNEPEDDAARLLIVHYQHRKKEGVG
jgi:hypothetical protein